MFLLRYHEFNSTKNPSYKLYRDLLKNICQEKNLTIYSLGMDIAAIILNEKANDKTLCISTGIHGDEIAGPWAVLRFLEEYQESTQKIIIMPVANPTGFDKGTRRNKDNFDLNRHGCHRKLTGENKILYDFWMEQKINFLATLHEDPGVDRFFLYHSFGVNKNLLQNLLDIGKKYFKIHDGKTVRGDKFTDKGLVGFDGVSGDCTMEDRMFREGVPYLVTETPSSLDLSKRIQCTLDIMRHIAKM